MRPESHSAAPRIDRIRSIDHARSPLTKSQTRGSCSKIPNTNRTRFRYTGTEMPLTTTALHSSETEENSKVKLFKATTTVCCMALMGTALTAIASADEYNEKTVVTFSG